SPLPGAAATAQSPSGDTAPPPYASHSVSQAGPPAPQATSTLGATTLATTNTYALISIILAFISPLAAIVFGHMALSQIKRNGDAGRGIALTGTIIGYAYFAVLALLIVMYIGFIFLMIGTMGAAFSGSGSEFGWYDGYDY